jgi:hypothetical protein
LPPAFLLTDTFLINVCFFVAAALVKKLNGETIDIPLSIVVASSVIWVLSTRLFKLYNFYTLSKYYLVLRATWRSIFVYILFFHLYTVLFHNSFPLKFLIFAYITVCISFILGRLTHRTIKDVLSKIYKQESVSVFAIASIGGHWVQLLRLMPLFNSNEVTFISTNSDMTKTLDGQKFYAVPDSNRQNKIALIKCCLSVSWFVLSERPRIIVTTGAAPGLFGIVIGKLLGLKTVWIDSIANVEKLSLSGVIASKIADRVYTQWEHLAQPNIIFAGNIIGE